MGDQRRSRQTTVTFGRERLLIDRTPAGLVAVGIPARREVIGNRVEVEALIAALRAAIEVSN